MNYELWKYHKKMYSEGLVVGTSGNISVKDRSEVLIKPSGVDYEELTPSHMVRVRMDGVVMDGMKPSTDTESHLYIYEHCQKVKSVIHTHSTFATAFAACGKNIDVFLTAMADEFGGVIPCSDYAEIGGAEVGAAVVENLNRSGVVLVRNHGLFAVGDSIKSAFKKALMAEDIARTTYYAMSMDMPIPLKQKQIESAYKRYHTSYGQ